jgi:hypothetical protein
MGGNVKHYQEVDFVTMNSVTLPSTLQTPFKKDRFVYVVSTLFGYYMVNKLKRGLGPT